MNQYSHISWKIWKFNGSLGYAFMSPPRWSAGPSVDLCQDKPLSQAVLTCQPATSAQRIDTQCFQPFVEDDRILPLAAKIRELKESHIPSRTMPQQSRKAGADVKCPLQSIHLQGMTWTAHIEMILAS
jgi:hypothetical protein